MFLHIINFLIAAHWEELLADRQMTGSCFPCITEAPFYILLRDFPQDNDLPF